MLNVLLVDDDYLVRMYLRQLIDWEAEGYRLVGDVCNGAEAMEAVTRDAPHIIITDLTMPVMDGIALIRRLKEENNPARIGVLSCHDEFAYVREAMKLGADEYVLKNVLDAAGLRTLLSSLRQGIQVREEEERQSEQLRWLAQKGNEALQRDALRRLRKEALLHDAQADFLKAHGISGDYYQCAVLELRIRRPEQTATAFQVCAQCIRDKTAVCAVLEERKLLVLLGFPGMSSAQAQHELLYRLAADLRDKLAGYANESPAIGFSQVLWGDGGVTRAMAQAAEAVLHAFYGETLCDYGQLSRLADALPEETRRVGPRLERYEPEAAAAALAACAQVRVRPELVLDWLATLDRGLVPDQPQPTPQSFADCQLRLSHYQRVWEAHTRDQTHKTDNLAVTAAATYIRAHFAQPLQLNQVAEEVGLNAAYLSHLFKKETGIGFSEYLQNCRMNFVRHRLAETGDSIKVIAQEAGFPDYQNFCKLFKKQCGLRPADYRRSAKSQTP